MNTLHKKIQKSVNQQTADLGVIQGVRPFKKGRKGRRITFFYSQKNQALMPCESELEAAHCLDMEFDKSIKLYRLQPFQIYFNGTKYTPDSLIMHADRTIEIREVKPAGVYELANVRRRLDVIKDQFSHHGVPFSVITEKKVHEKPGFYNRTYIYRAIRTTMTTYDIDYAKQLLTNTPFNTLDDVRKLFTDSGIQTLVAEKLIFEGFLKFNTSKKLDFNSRVWM